MNRFKDFLMYLHFAIYVADLQPSLINAFFKCCIYATFVAKALTQAA